MIFVVKRRSQDRENCQLCTNRKMLGGRNEYGVTGSNGEQTMSLKAHVGFSIPARKNISPRVVSHFSKLGYHLVDESSNHWIFERGNKLAALWRFDIHAYATKLRVRVTAQETGDLWVACDWEVWTFMTIATSADISTLEAEGHQLESVLRETE
jgi:hypothetical protein